MVIPYVFTQIRNLKAEGKSQAEIARLLGINPKTVAKYVRSNTPPQYKARTVTTRKDPFAGLDTKVSQWLKRTPELTDQEIYDLLIPEGYKGSERTVNRRMKRLRKVEPKERFFGQEYTPAEQSQFDFKEKVYLPFVDGVRLVNLHFGTLPYSDTCWVRGYPFKNYECFMDGVHSFFDRIGGQTKNIRFDNLSPVVKKVLKGSQRLYTDAFNRAVLYYGFGLLPCAPGKGNEKGDVERDIRTYSNRIKNRVSHEGLVFRDWEHLNAWLFVFMKERLKPASLSKFEEEKSLLETLPPREDNVLCQVEVSTATSYGSIRTGGKSTYSVPDSMIGHGCRVVIGAYDVRISRTGTEHNDKTVVIHSRKPDGEHSLHLEHVLTSLIRKPHAMVRWAHRQILFPSEVCERFYAKLQKIEGYSAECEYLRAINLVHHVPFSEIIVGMELVLETESLTLFDDLRALLLGERRPAEVIEITSRLNQSPLKPELSQYDSLIPKKGNPSR
jgi:transposase